jgi:hypothetical protein
MDGRDFSLNRTTEYQVVIIIEYDDGRMFPLTEDRPKCLLPIANNSLLSYQLDMLERSGATGLLFLIQIYILLNLQFTYFYILIV